jgi:hypothetical protein
MAVVVVTSPDATDSDVEDVVVVSLSCFTPHAVIVSISNARMSAINLRVFIGLLLCFFIITYFLKWLPITIIMQNAPVDKSDIFRFIGQFYTQNRSLFEMVHILQGKASAIPAEPNKACAGGEYFHDTVDVFLQRNRGSVTYPAARFSIAVPTV